VTIRFNGNQGVISVGEVDGETTKQFTFILSDVLATTQKDASLECIKQTCTSTTTRRGRRSSGSVEVMPPLEGIGVMTHKLTVQGSDDIYQKTLAKMSLVEEQNKKVRAKEIKPSGPNIGRRVRSAVAHNKSKASVAGSIQEVLARRSAALTSGSLCVGSRVETGQALVTPLSVSFTRERGGAGVRDARNLSLRDGIIHQLAVKTYTKPELLLRLKRDGIEEEEKQTLDQILAEVALLNVKENSYTLQRHLLSDQLLD